MLKGKKAGEMHASRETRRTRDARGDGLSPDACISPVFLFSPKLETTRTLVSAVNEYL